MLVDTNRGRATAWYRVRINLKNVPPDEHPPPEPPDPDYDPRSEYEDRTHRSSDDPGGGDDEQI